MSGRALTSMQKQSAATTSVGRILERNQRAGLERRPRPEARGLLQRKLTIGSSNHPLEHEADRAADQVMAGSLAAPARIANPARERIKEGDAAAPATVGLALANAGVPLQSDLRQRMEQGFGYDFSRVRVHTGGVAEQSAREVNARAYAVNADIVFGAGEFSPTSIGGQRLIAHELAHVVQQSGAAPLGAASRSSGPANRAAGGEAVIQRDDLASQPFVLRPDVAASWGLSPEQAAKLATPSDAAKTSPNAHTTKPGMGPKPGPHTLEETITAANVDPHQHKVNKDPPMMTLGDKFKKVITLAITEKLKGEGADRLKELLTPEAILTMAAFTAVYVASQLTPVGWVADILVGALLAATILMLGQEAIEIVKLLIEFCRKTSNAKSDPDYDEAATLFARAVSKLGIDIILAILFHKAGKAANLKPPTPRSPGLIEIMKPRGGTTKVPILQPAEGGFNVTVAGAEWIPAEPKPPGLMAEGQSGVGSPKGGDVGGAGKTSGGQDSAAQGPGKPPANLPGKNLAAADALAKKKLPAPGQLIDEAKSLDSPKTEAAETKSSTTKPAGEPSRSALRQELKSNLEVRIKDLQASIDEQLLEKKLIQKELQSIFNELKSIYDQLQKTSDDRSALLERKKDLEARREQLKQREADIGSTADLEQQKLKAKELINATGAEYLKALTDAASKRKEYLDVKALGRDEAFGTTGVSLEVDHVYPRSKIFEMSGFERLSWEQQIKIFNYRPNLKLIPAEVNSARGSMPYREWARNNRSSYAKNEAAIQSLSALETRMEAEIANLIGNPKLLQ